MRHVQYLGRAAAVAATLVTLTCPLLADEWTKVVPEEVGMSSERLQRLTDRMQAYLRVDEILRRCWVDAYREQRGMACRWVVKGIGSLIFC